ncbi:glycoside hydrolase [Pseudovirgaria hyperparasitica]|uniref:Glycoside hydrolase n=1 Tax=Pseudovirgaria hyperparasitica TaxID=470096 RepID=A0A6A6W4Z0_9PEZI|nr:glycoside hydrolase [Pseudovirgaria hyperparasitica]KAF2757998.1 glycoside hydrolase [Pseudovirgaria hyperparasitica]
MGILKVLTALLSTAAVASAGDVLAHVIIGNVDSYSVNQWSSEIKIAQAARIDGFILNTAADKATHESTIANAFTAAEYLNFKLAFSFDYLAQGPWAPHDVTDLLNRYGQRKAHFKVNGAPLVSTFEGPGKSGDWPSIRASVKGGIHFVPAWTSLGPSGFAADDKIGVTDGAFSWDMWPRGAHDVSAAQDHSWKKTVADKTFMMGVSPWFYTRLPSFGKAWLWRGDDMWHQRWQQVLDVQPDIVQIVTWNDYGESHYIGPRTGAVPPGADAYVNDMPHDGFRDLLPYYIARYKGEYPRVAEDKINMWYRLTAGEAGDVGGVTGNNCPSSINKFPDGSTCVDPKLVAQDKVFVTALLKAPGSVTVQIGDNPAVTHTFSAAGAQHTSQSMNGQTGAVKVHVVRDGATAASATGTPILARPKGQVVNFNVWNGGSKSKAGKRAETFQA